VTPHHAGFDHHLCDTEIGFVMEIARRMPSKQTSMVVE
jgi:hypothetical protein